MNPYIKITAYLLYPISIMYAVVVAIRNKAFDCGILRSQKHNIATIGVGNLSVGGTGKTPHVEYLVQQLQHKYNIALLSRGYKRTTKGFVQASPHTTAQNIGDEPYQMYNKFRNIHVAVCEKRNTGVEMLQKQCKGIDLVLMDDVYQHRHIKPDVMVLLTDYSNPFYTDKVMPFGTLREARGGYKRASVIVVSKCPQTMSTEQQQHIIQKIKPMPWQKVYFSYLEYGQPTNLEGTTTTLQHIQHILVVAGIANPIPLMEKVQETSKATLCQYPDHHNFDTNDIDNIKKQFEEIDTDNKIILTTEKDFVRIKTSEHIEAIKHLPIYYIPIQIKFHPTADTDTPFAQHIEKLIEAH